MNFHLSPWILPRAMLVGGLWVLFSPTIDAGLNFSPRWDSYELDGVVMSQLAFSTGTAKVATYEPPVGWKSSGGESYLDLQPANSTQAKARISKWPAEWSVSFDPNGLEQLKGRILSSLPAGNEQVRVETEALNPLQIDGKQTYVVELKYTYYGERFACYSLILDRKPEAICFRLSCRDSDYKKLRQEFERSLFTWQNL